MKAGADTALDLVSSLTAQVGSGPSATIIGSALTSESGARVAHLASAVHCRPHVPSCPPNGARSVRPVEVCGGATSNSSVAPVEPSTSNVVLSAKAAASRHMALVRISMGCLSSQRLNTLKAIMPTSIGSWLRNATLWLPKMLTLVRWAAHRL